MTILIQGPCSLKGRVSISGSKNASLPLLCSSFLFNGPLRLNNVPDLLDISVLLNLLRSLGSKIVVSHQGLSLHYTEQPNVPLICSVKAAKIRGSILLLAPFLGRYGQILLPLPGGCNIGKRPIDFHLYALEQLGAEFSILPQGIYGTLPSGGFKGGTIIFPKPTVTGTENALMAASIAKGTTIIENPAQDDEVYELIALLRASGVAIETSEDIFEIQGSAGLLPPPSEPFEICADRMEAGTFLAACGITQGEIALEFDRCPGLEPVIAHLQDMGMSFAFNDKGIQAAVLQPLKAGSFITAPHPGFPTDLQAPFLALNCVSTGSSFVQETIWENRFLHAQEFIKMGADLKVSENTVIINGVPKLHAASLKAHDLRGSAATILLALRAEGTSEIHQASQHYERGYSFFIEKLRLLGANISLNQRQSVEHYTELAKNDA